MAILTDPISFVVNDVNHTVTCDPQTPLLYVLRNDLGLTAAKFGCGLGLCGACTVIIDGTSVHSCDTPMWSVDGRTVRTLEGLGTAERPHPLQQSFIDHQAMQCGYCVPGMIMSAAALLEHDPDAGDTAIRASLDGNLCRCGAHNRILRAVHAARDAANGEKRR